MAPTLITALINDRRRVHVDVPPALPVAGQRIAAFDNNIHRPPGLRQSITRSSIRPWFSAAPLLPSTPRQLRLVRPTHNASVGLRTDSSMEDLVSRCLRRPSRAEDQLQAADTADSGLAYGHGSNDGRSTAVRTTRRATARLPPGGQ